jgi:signal transduction histidine kinase
LGLFLADAVVSLFDDSLIVLFDVHLLSGIRGTVSLLAMLTALLVYGLMGLTPMVPKRLFLPLTLFSPVAILGVVFISIYFYGQLRQAAWVLSFSQLVLGLGILYCVRGGFEFRWPLIEESRLQARRFSWLNLCAFLLVNIFLLLPAVGLYLLLCASLAVDHFSDGFIALRRTGVTVQVRKYVRNDGKTIELVPMSHIGEPEFYRKLSQSFPTNSLILMEGVTDNRNLLTNRLSYKRAATSLGR